jgi:hypothetical protein
MAGSGLIKTTLLCLVTWRQCLQVIVSCSPEHAWQDLHQKLAYCLKINRVALSLVMQ